MKQIDVGLSLMLEDDFHQAAQPLFESQQVDIVEWSFDMGWGRPLPAWLQKTLMDFSGRSKLIGHGVSYSTLDASQTSRQAAWLSQLQIEVAHRRYQHISEHFGFMGGGNFHLASPLPVPRTPTTVAIGQQRLRELALVAQVPVGLENLAFAFNLRDVQSQGPFLDELLEPVNGFLVLDLHNLYCQSCNFGIPVDDLIAAYPLERVIELHVSGGGWSEHPQGSGAMVRRDTHDAAVPEEVFAAIPGTIAKCKNLRAVILERLGGTLHSSPEDAAKFREDFLSLKRLVVTGN